MQLTDWIWNEPIMQCDPYHNDDILANYDDGEHNWYEVIKSRDLHHHHRRHLKYWTYIMEPE